MKKKQIKFECTVEQLDQINSHAKSFNLATGTYLRNLGLLGIAPYRKTTELSVQKKSVYLVGTAAPATLGVFQERRRRGLHEHKESFRPTKDRRSASQ